MASSNSTACVSCHKVLTLLIEPNETDEEDEAPAGGAGSSSPEIYVDDDVHMPCGCHFHWQCLLDAYSMTECPNCGRDLTRITPTGQQQVVCSLKNEGGLQEGLDILPLLTEETYLKAFPEERKCQAFLEFCGEGDIEAIVDMLKDDREEDDEEGSNSGGNSIDVMRYQDQIKTLSSGLHVAIQNQQIQVAWLLLLLASNLAPEQFPPEIITASERLGVSREEQTGKKDIRELEDAEGITAEQRAAAMGGIWQEWVQSGRLRAT